MNDTPTTVVDARWIDKAGTTTFSRSLLEGLADVRPPGRWVLWGPEAMIGPILWPGVVHVPTTVDPSAWFGQRSAFRVPRGDLILHPHQTRPWHRLPAATCVLDLIQLQDPRAAIRAAKAVRLRAAVRAARLLFTISGSVRDELIATFHVDPQAVTVLNLPVDAAAAGRVAARRAKQPPDRVILAVGRFVPHKNLDRLVQAFSRTRFAATGGQLHLLGGTAEQLSVGTPLPRGLRVLGVVDQAGLEDALSGATALIQASLVEGYGLPVSEALVAGVPVMSSPVPAVTEFGPVGVPVFDPRSVAAIADTIDRTIDLVDQGRYWAAVDRAAWLPNRPTRATLARQVLGALATINPGRRPAPGRKRLP